MLGFESGDSSGRSDSEGGLGFERFRDPIKDDLKGTEFDYHPKSLLDGFKCRVSVVESRESIREPPRQ